MATQNDAVKETDEENAKKDEELGKDAQMAEENHSVKETAEDEIMILRCPQIIADDLFSDGRSTGSYLLTCTTWKYKDKLVMLSTGTGSPLRHHCNVDSIDSIKSAKQLSETAGFLGASIANQKTWKHLIENKKPRAKFYMWNFINMTIVNDVRGQFLPPAGMPGRVIFIPRCMLEPVQVAKDEDETQENVFVDCAIQEDYAKDSQVEVNEEEDVCCITLNSTVIRTIANRVSKSLKGRSFWMFSWKNKQTDGKRVFLMEQGNQSINHCCRIEIIDTISSCTELTSSQHYKDASRSCKKLWRGAFNDADGGKLYTWNFFDFHHLPEALQLQETSSGRGRNPCCRTVKHSNLKLWREPHLVLSLECSAKFFLRSLPPASIEALRSFAYRWDGHTIRVGTTCSGTDICVIVFKKTIEVIAEFFKVSWQHIYIYIYILYIYIYIYCIILYIYIY